MQQTTHSAAQIVKADDFDYGEDDDDADRLAELRRRRQEEEKRAQELKMQQAQITPAPVTLDKSQVSSLISKLLYQTGSVVPPQFSSILTPAPPEPVSAPDLPYCPPDHVRGTDITYPIDVWT